MPKKSKRTNEVTKENVTKESGDKRKITDGEYDLLKLARETEIRLGYIESEFMEIFWCHSGEAQETIKREFPVSLAVIQMLLRDGQAHTARIREATSD